MKREQVEGRAAITGPAQFSEAQRLRLLADVLAFFTTDPARVDVKPIKAMLQDSRFTGYTRGHLKTLVTSLMMTGLLFKPPQYQTRNTGYVTTRAGREALARYLAQLEGE